MLAHVTLKQWYSGESASAPIRGLFSRYSFTTLFSQISFEYLQEDEMEQGTNQRGLSRRQFLQVTGGLSLAALLAAGAPGAAAPTTVGEPAPPAAAGAQEINFLVRPDIRSAYAADAAVESWNKD